MDGSAMVAAPSPTTSINWRALSSMKLDITRLGMKAFNITFPALLGPLLSTTLRNSVNRKIFSPKDPRQIALHEHIFDALIVTMLHLPQIMVDMEAECGRDGPKAFYWLNDRYNPKAAATSIVTLMDIFKKPMGENLQDDLQAKISENAGLPDGIKLPDGALTVLLLVMFPPSLHHLRDIIVERDELPDLQELRNKVTNAMHFADAVDSATPHHSSFATIPNAFCFKCDKTGHFSSSCSLASVECEECGPGNHLTKFCFIRNDKPLPPKMSAAKKQEIFAKRKTFQATQGQAANTCYDIDDDENFWNIIEGKK
jgi:hypothetical protein